MSNHSSEILQSMDGIAKISEQNAASIQEFSATSEQQAEVMQGIVPSAQKLAELAEGLQRMIEHFYYKKEI